MSTSESYIISDASPSSDNDEIDSLPSISSGTLSDIDSDAQREWEASLEQLQLLLTMVLIPFAGKYFGRKFAYWSRFTHHGQFAAPRRVCLTAETGWARYMEWMHDVEIRWTNKKAFKATGAVEAAVSL